MAFRYVAFLAFVAAAQASGVAVGYAPVASAVVADAPANYDFGYSVNDPYSGDNKDQQESRRGDAVVGRYSLIEADGSRRVVNYAADAVNGFNAVVNKELPVAAAPVVARVAAPVVSAVAAPAVARFAAPVAAPAVARLSAPALSYASAPALSYAAAPAVNYAAAPALNYAAAPALSYAAAPALSYAAAPAVARFASVAPSAYSNSYSSSYVASAPAVASYAAAAPVYAGARLASGQVYSAGLAGPSYAAYSSPAISSVSGSVLAAPAW